MCICDKIHEIALKLVKSGKIRCKIAHLNWRPYWLLLHHLCMPARLSYQLIFEHFIMGDHHFQSSKIRMLGGNRLQSPRELPKVISTPYPENLHHHPGKARPAKSVKISKISKQTYIKSPKSSK